MRNRVLSVLALISVFLFACTEPTTIDGSSSENFSKSILSLSKKLNDHEREVFMQSLKTINENKGGWSSSLEKPSIPFLSSVNGKTLADIKREALEIERHADILGTKRAISELQVHFQKINGELKSLEAWYASRNGVKNMLAGLQTSGAVITEINKTPIGIQSSIKFRVLNSTEKIVYVKEANVIVEYDKVRQIYPLLGSGCFGNFLEKDKGRILPAQQKEFVCSQFMDISGHTGLSIQITGGEIVGVGSYSDELRAIGMNDDENYTKKSKEIREKQEIVRSTLLMKCEHIAKLTNEQCVW